MMSRFDPSAMAEARMKSVWETRRARALRLIEETPHAEEVLSTYADLVELQARVAARVPTRLWTILVGAADGMPPRLRLERLPIDDLVPHFVEFLGEAEDLGTEGMRTDAGALSSAPPSTRVALFGAALTGRAATDEAPFHVRAFLQPVATALAEATEIDQPAPARRAAPLRTDRCPVCGAPPMIATIGGTHRGHGLVCGICGSSWPVPRMSCGRCAENDPSWLVESAGASLPHVRLHECQRCGRYRKAVDLDACAEAVPLVEDLATPDLDARAREGGLTRAENNLFGF
jgi:formate dehydrogenase maturation protein FdhE